MVLLFDLLLLPLISPLGLEVYSFNILLDILLLGNGLLPGSAQAPLAEEDPTFFSLPTEEDDPARRGGPCSWLGAEARPHWQTSISGF
jgi:hypothetical protein